MTTGTKDAITVPQVGDVRESLALILEEDFDAAWARVCDGAHVALDAHLLDDGEFAHLLDALELESALCRVLSTSWRIRRTAARKLAELGR